MPKYMLLFLGSDEARQGATAEQREHTYAEIGKWWEEHARKGIITGGEELQPASTATMPPCTPATKLPAGPARAARCTW